MHRYFAHGLIVDSEIVLPGALPLPGRPAGTAPITIRTGPADAPEKARHLGPYSYTADCIHIAEPDVAQVLCRTGGEITVHPAAGSDEMTIGSHLIATALPAQLWWRGDVVLHAAGVVLPGHVTVTAVAGPSGAGKSEVAAQCLASGAELVGDDTLRLWRGPRGWRVAGLPGGYFHRSPDGTRQFIELRGQQPAPARPLGRILALALPRGAAPCLSPLTGTEALSTLLANRHRPRLPELMGLEAKQRSTLTALSAYLPVTRWDRAEGQTELHPEERSMLFG